MFAILFFFAVMFGSTTAWAIAGHHLVLAPIVGAGTMLFSLKFVVILIDDTRDDLPAKIGHEFDDSHEIVITKRSSDYHAALKRNETIWGCGNSPNAALGDLIRSHAVPFNFEIEFRH